jgi:uncharacterized membrane protein
MRTGRLEAFSDGVIAILITIMVLELRPPEHTTFSALQRLWPTLLSYVLSFVILGIYWNNHHHLFQATRVVNGRVLWANMHLLFWLSLFPFGAAWMGEHHFDRVPAATYGVIMLMAAVAYFVLVRAILSVPEQSRELIEAIGGDFKGKISLAIYALSAVAAFVSGWLAFSGYVLVAAIWFIPDRRIEQTLPEHATPLDDSASS